MIKVNLRKKGLIGISLALALCVLGVGAHSLRAASRVDTTKTVRITAKIDSSDDSKFASEYKGDVNIKLYKIATLDATGAVALTDEFKNSGVDLGVLNNKPTVDDIKKKIVAQAVETAESINALDKVWTITLDRKNQQTSNYTSIAEGAGLYLYLPQDASDDRYTYKFTPYVIFAPNSEYISSGQGSDEWNYDVSFNLKSSEERKYGDLTIKKKLDNYNEDLGVASFVYKIKAQLDEGTVVFDDVRTLDFSSAGEREITITIPTTAKVTVEEVNKGSSYKVVGVNWKYSEDNEEEVWHEAAGADKVENIEITAENPVIVEFENEYDDTKLISGGISAVNTYEKLDGEYVHVDNIPR